MPEDLRHSIRDAERKRILASFAKWRWFFIAGIALFGVASLCFDFGPDWSRIPPSKGTPFMVSLVFGVYGTVIPAIVFWKFPNTTVLARIENHAAQGNPHLPFDLDLFMPPLLELLKQLKYGVYSAPMAADAREFHPLIAGLFYARFEYLAKMGVLFSAGMCGCLLSEFNDSSLPTLLSVPVAMLLMHRQPFLIDTLILQRQ